MEKGEFDLLETDAETILSEQCEEGATNGDTFKDFSKRNNSPYP